MQGRGIMTGALRKIILFFVLFVIMGGTAARGDGGEIILDNGDGGTSFTGVWKPSTAAGSFGGDSLWGISGSEYTWHAALPETGNYEVYLWWTAPENRAPDAPIEIVTSGGSEIVRIDQRVNGGRWNLLGQFPFTGEGGGKVTLKAEKSSHWIFNYLPEWMQPATYCADAVKFIFIPEPDDNEEPEPGENEKPTARIEGLDFSYTFQGNPARFRGAGEDPDGTITGYAWHSSIDGDLSEAGSFTTSSLSTGQHVIAFKVMDDKGAWSDPVEAGIEVKPRSASVEQIFLCLGYAGMENRPLYVEELSRLGAVDKGSHWELFRPDQQKTFLFYLIENIEAMRTALETEKAHVIYEGHSNYGLGGLFATTDEIRRQKLYDVLYIDDDRIFNYSSPWVNIRLQGLRTQQAFPFWWPVFKDGTSGIMPYDFGDPRGNPPYNYWITYQIPGDPTHYKLETVRNSGLDRFYGSDVPAWFDSDGNEPDPENPEHRQYFITNTEEWSPSVRMTGDWNETFIPGDCYDENYHWAEAGTGEKCFSWLFRIPREGYYVIDGWWSTRPDATSRATYRVNHAGGTALVAVNQKTAGGRWNRFGEYYFEPGEYSVDLADDQPSGTVVADAVRVNHVDNPPEALEAHFSGVRYGTLPMYVRFRNESTGFYNSRLWNLGDGYTNNTRDDLIYEYTKPGEYTVSLTVSGPSGSSTSTREKYIVVDGKETVDFPQADFSARNRSGAPPLDVRFQDRSYGDFVRWTWDFGDGSSSFEQAPTHRYENPGNYTVTLTATGASGEKFSVTKKNFIRVLIYEKITDNMDYPKTHEGGKIIVYRGEPDIREEDLKFSRMFYYGCNTGNYFLDTFHRGVIFYTVNADLAGAVFPYLAAYVNGASDYEIWQAVQEHMPVFDYYDFSKRPWEQEAEAGAQTLRGTASLASSGGAVSRRAATASLVKEVLSVPLDDRMRELVDPAFKDQSRLLLSDIPRAFEGKKDEAISRAIESLRYPEGFSANGNTSLEGGGILLARGLFEAFSGEAVDPVLRAYEGGTITLRGNLLLSAGRLLHDDRRVKELLLSALLDHRFAEEAEDEAEEGTPMRLCDLAYNQIVLHLEIPGVLRTLGPIHSLETRDDHIGILKGELGIS